MNNEIPKQQHFLNNIEEYSKLLESIDLSKKNIIEIGCGTGVLTELLIKRNPKWIIGFEIDKSVFRKIISLQIKYDYNFLPLYQEWNKEKCIDIVKEFYKFRYVSLISNPPYLLLDKIKEMIKDIGIKNVILMIPETRLSEFPDYKLEFTLTGKDFTPEAEGNHCVIRRGFKN